MGMAAGRSIDRVDIGILVAMPLEAAAIVERLRRPVAFRAADRRVSVGRLGSASVAVMATGVGGAAAVRGMRVLVSGHRPDRLVAAGLCGGLDPALARGAILLADRVGLSASAESTACDRFLPVDPPPACDPRPEPGIVRGLLVTTDTVVATAAAKRAIHDATGAVAVDMESWWIADEARRVGLPVHVVRAVCDTATETVPADIASLAAGGSTARLAGAAVRLLWRRPAAAIEMVELRERAHAAAAAVALQLESIFAG